MKTDAALGRKRQLNFINITWSLLCEAGWPLGEADHQQHSPEPRGRTHSLAEKLRLWAPHKESPQPTAMCTLMKRAPPAL